MTKDLKPLQIPVVALAIWPLNRLLSLSYAPYRIGLANLPNVALPNMQDVTGFPLDSRNKGPD